jgi:hypothetical protein
MRDERWIEKDLEGSAHVLMEEASQCFPEGTEGDHGRDLNTVRPDCRPRAVPLSQLVRYESKITYSRSHAHSHDVILGFISFWRKTYGLAEQLSASLRSTSCCVILYFVIVFCLNTTTIKISFAFTVYNEFISFNSMTLCYVFRLIKPSTVSMY